jgi:sugar transferase (PEP-CTERM/EpsH1 system associated)
MRILFIAHRMPYPPNKGEKIRAFWELCELAKEHTVDLFCFYDDPEDKQHARQLSQYCNRYYLEKRSFFWSRARAVAASLSGRPFSVAFFHSRRMTERVKLALRSRSYDRIFVFSSSMAQYVEDANNIPRVLDFVDVDSDKWLQYANRSSWPWSWLWSREAKRLGAYESELVRTFSTTLVCTDAEAQLLRSKAPIGGIRTLENFLDVDQYDSAQACIPDRIRSWEPYVIFSGSMDYRPNVDAVSFFYREVFPLVCREVPEVRLVIAGRNPHRSITNLQSDLRVHVTGNVSDIRPYIWGASVAVVPMRIARGVQTKILEALASGIPVVSTSAAASALPEVLRSLVTVADGPQEIAAAIIVELRNGQLRNGASLPSHVLRAILKNYMENLDLRTQLQTLMRDPKAAEGRENLMNVGCENITNRQSESEKPGRETVAR